MIRIFENMEEYNTFTHTGKNMVSGDLYWVKENKRAFFLTNNIDGEVTSYDMMGEIPEEYIIPSGNIAITENGEGIDVKNYATASVNVPIPDGYIVPSGNIAITENGENIDVTNYATATVNVPSTGGAEDLISFIEGHTTTLTIPEGTTTISSNIFQNYTKPKSVIIPDSVEMINMNAFDGCTSLTEVTIGSGVKTIDNYAFQNCTSLTSITVLATTPPMLNQGAFDNTNDCPIYVPEEKLLDYQMGSGSWPYYFNRIKAIGTVTGGDPSGGNPSGGPVIN